MVNSPLDRQNSPTNRHLELVCVIFHNFRFVVFSLFIPGVNNMVGENVILTFEFMDEFLWYHYLIETSRAVLL